jgi:hypothetical protein
LFLGVALALIVSASAGDREAVAAFDVTYQAAVKNNDEATMSRILGDDFALVVGISRTQTKVDLLREAREKVSICGHQEDSDKTVRVWGGTAVVTALLRAKGTQNGKSFVYKVWFSDTYVRTPAGWRYVFGQASLPLPK